MGCKPSKSQVYVQESSHVAERRSVGINTDLTVQQEDTAIDSEPLILDKTLRFSSSCSEVDMNVATLNRRARPSDSELRSLIEKLYLKANDGEQHAWDEKNNDPEVINVLQLMSGLEDDEQKLPASLIFAKKNLEVSPSLSSEGSSNGYSITTSRDYYSVISSESGGKTSLSPPFDYSTQVSSKYFLHVERSPSLITPSIEGVTFESPLVCQLQHRLSLTRSMSEPRQTPASQILCARCQDINHLSLLGASFDGKNKQEEPTTMEYVAEDSAHLSLLGASFTTNEKNKQEEPTGMEIVAESLERVESKKLRNEEVKVSGLLSGELLQNFELTCPPNGQDKVVLYVTSLQGIRKTYEDCKRVAEVLHGLGVVVDERDVSMHAEFLKEMRKLLEKEERTVPRVFIRGRYIGGANEVLQLNEEGKLLLLVEGLPRHERKACQGCGGLRFIPCTLCNGSCKIIGEEGEVDRCRHCNENGLMRCPFCC